MSVHDYHPEVYEPGNPATADGPVLSDACQRCTSIAVRPAGNLDTSRRYELVRRTAAGEPHRSINDLTAARRLAVPR